jgi:hypothetical protein
MKGDAYQACTKILILLPSCNALDSRDLLDEISFMTHPALKVAFVPNYPAIFVTSTSDKQ